MLLSLEPIAGLPLSLDPETATLRWPAEIHVEETASRRLAEMKPLLADPRAHCERETIYTIYRNVGRASDLATIQAAGLRYDITIIAPGAFAGAKTNEFFKTAGHYHRSKLHTDVAYPEVYEVLAGRAYWIIQRPACGEARPRRPDSRNADRVAEAYLMEVGPGEKALIPPGFGHVAINAYPEPLVLANWISAAVQYDYDSYRSKRGAAYWAFAGSEPASAIFKPNPRYRGTPALRKLVPRELPEFGLERKIPLYGLIRDFAKLRFASDPEDFTHLLTIEHCFEAIEARH